MIPMLEDDIVIPEFIEAQDFETSIWIGPDGTHSPRHKDPKMNFFCQIKGEKHFLFDDLQCYVSPGEVLFIPKEYYHDVKSLTNSISLNFWFDK